jgi:hypothetical protein
MEIIWVYYGFGAKIANLVVRISIFFRSAKLLVHLYTIVRKFALSIIVRIIKIFCKKLQFCTISHFPIFPCFDAWKTYTWEILGVLAEKTGVRENCLPVFNENLLSLFFNLIIVALGQ